MPVTIRHSVVAAPIPIPTTWPKLSDTGTTGTLTLHTGSNDFSVNGQLVQNKIFRGTVSLYGANITFRNCRFEAFSDWGILHQKDPSISYNCSLENCHFDGGGAVGTTAIGIGQSNGTGGGHVTGCRVEGVTIGINCFGPVRVEGCYIFNMWSTSTNELDLHFDGIAVWGVGGQVIRNNALDISGGTANFFAKNVDNGDITNILIENNLMIGNPTFPVFLDDIAPYVVSGVTIKDNYMERGGVGYIGYDTPPTEINNTQWDQSTDVYSGHPVPDPRPPAVLAWDAKI